MRPRVTSAFAVLLGVFFVLPASAATLCCKCIDEQKAPNDTVCIQTTKTACADLGVDGVDLSCFESLTEGQCQTVGSGGICVKGPVTESDYKIEQAKIIPESVPATPPKLGVPIPGLEFAQGITSQAGYVIIPFIAQYITAVYKWLIGAAAVAAAIMIIYGGALYIIGGTGARIRSGKKILIDAIVGLLLVLGAYTILAGVNPETLSFEGLRLKIIDPEDVGMYSASIPLQQDPVTRGSLPAPPKAAGNLVEAIMNGAKAANVDPCLMLANCEHETRLNSTWNGSFAGNPKEKASYFGACGVGARNLRGNGPYYQTLRRRYPSFPELSTDPKHQVTREEILKIGDWILQNPEGDAYAASLLFKDGVKLANGNDILAVAAFKAGSTSMSRWAKANGCTPERGLTFKEGLKNPKSALQRSCVPHLVAIPSVGDPPKGCPEDGYVCQDVKANRASEWQGHCKDGRSCKAMVTDESVLYILDAYPRMIEQYQCDR